ncbi:hypothetical protein DPMN_104792 [Dreissena polymorpha]|uniref:Uncharacterized protein n=1 Tax=Dreissena polymorpha TaxID=45954 RepID=A0A9D4HCN2_DREPO|nr:hypothetical protein DPMN_104792 [Dreissena polymorpha]
MVYDHNCDYNEITGGKTPRLLNSDDEEEATTEVQKTCGGKPPKVTKVKNMSGAAAMFVFL